MTMGAPWSVKGIDPKAREVAKDLARRSGMTLGEWLNRVILEDDVPEDVTSEDHFSDRTVRPFEARPRLVSSGPSRTDDLSRVAYALDRLTDRIESSETRTSLAISGVEHSVRAAVARIEAGEREHLAVAARVDSEQARAGERLRRLESDPVGPRSAEAMAAIEARLGRIEGLGGGDPAPLIDEVVRRLGERLADAEGRTGGALESLRGALASLDRRLGAVEGGGAGEAERKLEALATGLAERVEAARAEIAQRLAATESGRIDERFADLASQVEAAERRSAQAVERMGREVIGVAEAFSRRLQASEARSAQSITEVGGEIARIASAVEQRLSRTETAQSEALEKLGAEIGRITERLTDRMLQSERRAAQAIDDVGDQVSRVTERIEQRHERISNDLAERLRESEARTTRLLEEASERLQGRAVPTPDAEAPITGHAVFGPELFSRAEPLEVDAGPKLPPIEAADFAPIPEADDDVLGLKVPEPPSAGDGPAARPLSTREVIDQARAAARAADGARPRMQVKARANWRAAPYAAKPQVAKSSSAKSQPRHGRAAGGSTLQTAFMIAGGAAFLSVGAAGMVLMNAGGGQEVVEASPFGAPPRAAVALAPQPMSALAPGAVESPAAPAAPASASQAPAQPLSSQYLNALREVEAGEPGALARMKSLADADYAPAQFYMSKVYETGAHGAVKNAAEARRWAARSAVNGEARGMHNLALYYFEGAGGPQDLTGAARWFRKAAELGVGDSQYNLGLLYQAGSGVPRDLAEAYKWFAIAAAGGDAMARSGAVDLEKKLSAAQLAAADKAAAEFRPQGQAPGRAPAVSVATAQRILGRLGYYKGQPTGAGSRDFSLAVAAYQRDQGLAATGALDPNTTQRLSVFSR
jgi:localization factor PodJL